jgi:hypothetical protein
MHQREVFKKCAMTLLVVDSKSKDTLTPDHTLTSHILFLNRHSVQEQVTLYLWHTLNGRLLGAGVLGDGFGAL